MIITGILSYRQGYGNNDGFTRDCLVAHDGEVWTLWIASVRIVYIHRLLVRLWCLKLSPSHKSIGNILRDLLTWVGSLFYRILHSEHRAVHYHVRINTNLSRGKTN